MFIDSHCHIDYVAQCEGTGSAEDIIQRAQDAGVEHMLSVCIDLQQFATLQALAVAHEAISISVGIHPTDVKQGPVVSTDTLLALADDAQVVAFGETGLDYFRETEATQIAAQKASFIAHIEAAKTAKKPLIIHARDAFPDIFTLLKAHRADTIGGVMHCFTGTLDEAKMAIDCGFDISFSGIITFKNAKALQAVAAALPLAHILIETDSPYLAPVPFRGKTNEPSYVRFVAEQLALLQGVSVEQMAKQTRENFFRRFPVKR
jgi:TatD DNase family protein